VTSALLTEIYRAVVLLPPAVLDELAIALSTIDEPYSDSLASNLLSSLTNVQFRRAIADVLNTWKNQQNSWSSRAIAAALLSAACTNNTIQDNLTVELVWTGPESATIPIRRTDQVLLQLIRECREELTLISFAIYKVPEVVQALLQALERGIKLRIIAETPESGAGKIPFGFQSTFGTEILSQSQVLIWPKEKRLVDANGKYGSLHVKGAIVDQKKLFITSANLTEYALALNMELGVLVQNDDLAKQLISQINDLLSRDILIPLEH